MAEVTKPVNMDPQFVTGTTVTLTDVEVRYAHVINPDTKFGSEWSVGCSIDPATAQVMKDLGFNITEDAASGKYWVKAKRVTRTRGGVDQSPPKIAMEDGTPVTANPGNGTVADVHLWCKYTAPIQGKIHMGTYLNGMTVKVLVEATTESAVRF